MKKTTLLLLAFGIAKAFSQTSTEPVSYSTSFKKGTIELAFNPANHSADKIIFTDEDSKDEYRYCGYSVKNVRKFCSYNKDMGFNNAIYFLVEINEDEKTSPEKIKAQYFTKGKPESLTLERNKDKDVAKNK